MEPGRWQTWHFCWRIGATSFVKVWGARLSGPTERPGVVCRKSGVATTECFACALAVAANATAARVPSRLPTTDTRIPVILFSRSRRHRDFDETIGPAALRVAGAFDARRVVESDAQRVFARLRKRDPSGRLARR